MLSLLLILLEDFSMNKCLYYLTVLPAAWLYFRTLPHTVSHQSRWECEAPEYLKYPVTKFSLGLLANLCVRVLRGGGSIQKYQEELSESGISCCVHLNQETWLVRFTTYVLKLLLLT